MAHSGKTITFATDLLPNEDNIYSLGLIDNNNSANNRRWKVFGDVTGNADSASAISAALSTNTKTYLLGTQTQITSTPGNVNLTGDTGVYLTTTAGQLSSTSYSVNYSGNEKVQLQWNNTDAALEFIFI